MIGLLEFNYIYSHRYVQIANNFTFAANGYSKFK